MSFNFIIGGAGKGKTRFVYEYLINKSLSMPNKNIILIVPEQFTMQTQKDLVTNHPNKGIMKIEVLSFQRLAYRIFEELGSPTKKILGDTGKSMVLRKVIWDKEKDLTYFSKMVDKYGFIDGLKTLVTELYQYEFSKTDLSDLGQNIEEKPILKEKIKDIYTIYSAFQTYIEENYITTEETLDLLKDKILKSNILKDAIVVFDGFYGFTPQQYSLIRNIGQVSEELFFTLSVDTKEELYQPADETDLFYESKKTFNKLIEIAGESGIKYNEPTLIDEDMESQDIGHLAGQIFRFPYSCKENEVNDIEITACVNPIKECEYLCRVIHQLVKVKGYDYKDIAVITGDLQGYRFSLERLFRLYQIPYFIDNKKEILSNPLIELIRSALDIYVTDWSFESIFKYIKTGFIDIDNNSKDLLENFVLQYGIKGKKTWVEENWYEKYKERASITEYEERCLELIEQTRQNVVITLEELTTVASHSKKTVQDMTKALYQTLIKLNCPEKIDSLCSEFEEKNNLLLKREYSQIWKMVIDLFDKIVEVLGEEKISTKEYARLIEAGLEQCEMGLVPPSLNQILVGDLERTRLQGVKALFIIGFNDGLIPAIKKDEGIITDDERDFINTLGKELADSNKKKIYEEHFLVYNALCKPKNQLYLTYSLADIDGGALRPSFLISQIKKIFPKLKERFDDPRITDESYITLPTSTLYYLIAEKRKEKDNIEIQEVWNEVYNWYMSNDKWKDTIEKVERGFVHNNQEPSLKSSSINKLYGNSLYSSISQLESFAACPFAYYVQYGLKAKERKLNEIKSPDVGIFFHLVLENFAKKIEDRQLIWQQLNDDERNGILEDTINEITPILNYSAFFNSNRNKYLKYRLKNIAKKAVNILQEHLKRGDFTPKDFELSFGGDGKLPAIEIKIDNNQEMQLTGKVDRVDLLEEQEQLYVKIIDYKSGSQDFDMVAVFNGLQLQLIVYLDALINLGQEYYGKPLRPAGIFYFKVDDPILNNDLPSTTDDLQEMLLKQFRLSGLVLSDEEVIKKMDKTLESSSSIIPVRKTKDGFHKTHSSIASKEQFELLQKYAKKKATTLGKEILSGNVSINPYKLSEKTGCDFCKFSSICQFDTKLKDNSYNYLEQFKKDVFWEMLVDEMDSE